MTRIEITRAERGPVQVSITPGMLQARLVGRHGTGAHVALVAGGAMLVGGDHVGVDVHVGSGCALDLEDVGGAVAYPTENGRSRFDVRIRVDDGATLVWRAHPFVIADGAAVDRDMTVELGAGAALCLRETLVLGRTGERGGEIRSRLRARNTGGSPLHLEDLDLSGRRPAVGVVGAHRVLDSVILLGRRPTDPVETDGHPAPVVLHLEAPGAIARTVADTTHRTGLDAVFTQWSEKTS
ncbi:urease accessory protein UreD [Brachybacterium sacelli]|uniref:Urease accessory protein n=1 Tax=Brachybacterium sacelli TaxID=173364 RepID=A0ABS4WZM4_9MICO|nr:urease accessory protein UreD [Brachybacterium sacelli]MBP2381657.1 urease accessory protein [Brachybacterium sacelli]